mmetsp:Transcript_75258/g.243345  ORF Transcript_75258/g.243345 Transcript_75258/m.243345 type:complete len:365 (-) Transcript_75258:1184-2278(-)
MREPPMHRIRAVDAAADEPCGEAFADFNDSREELGVVKALRKRGDGHHLRNSAKAVDGWRLQAVKVLQTIGNQLKCVRNELVQAMQGLQADALRHNAAPRALHGQELARPVRGGPRKLAKVVRGGVLAPDGLRPEGAAVHIVLEVVTDDVCLLQKEAHGVGNAKVGGLLLRVGAERPDVFALARKRLVLRPASQEDACEALAHQARHHVAITVVGRLVHCPLSQICRHILSHASAHLVGDVTDDSLGALGQGREDPRHGAELLHQRALVAGAHALDAAPVVRQPLRAEGAELGLLVLLAAAVGLHVVLDGVERPQHEVEDADVQAEAFGKLADDGCEGARDLAEHVVAESYIWVVAVALQVVLE